MSISTRWQRIRRMSSRLLARDRIPAGIGRIHRRVPWREREDWLWPEGDKGLLKVFDTWKDAERALALTSRQRSVVQAGGACGVFAAYLGTCFEHVYTFEPHPLNFYCLAQNAPQPNVYKLQAALGSRHEPVALSCEARHRDRNFGAFFVSGRGSIPMLCIDDLGLTDCDLIYLDVEGLESEVLEGAKATLAHSDPVVVVESKGLRGALRPEHWLTEHGYDKRTASGRDLFFVRGSRLEQLR